MRYVDEPALSGGEICPVEQKQSTGLPSLLSFTSYQWKQGGRTNWNAILQLCTNKLMNDNGSLIEATGAILSTDCGAANGVFWVVMVTGAKRLWRSPDLSWSQINFYTCSQYSEPSFQCICMHEYLLVIYLQFVHRWKVWRVSSSVGLSLYILR